MPTWIDHWNWSLPQTSLIQIQFPIKGYFSWGTIMTERTASLSWVCIQQEWQSWRKLQEQLFTIMIFTLVQRLKTARGRWTSECGIIPFQFSSGSLKRRHELYKRRISEPQWWKSCDLEKNRRKMLACICPDVASCDGHVLAQMVHNKQSEY